jgi:hypothetical protein
MIKFLLPLAIFGVGICSFAETNTKDTSPKVSCGVSRLKDDVWIKKPSQVPMSKIGEGFTLYKKDELNIEANLDRDNLTLSANKSKKVIAVFVTEDSTSSIQLALPETGLQIVCNTDKLLLKVTLPH